MKRWIKCLSCIALAITTACGGQPKTLMLAEAPPDLLDRCQDIAINVTHTVPGRHGDVVAGAGEGAAVGALQGASGVAGADTGGDPYAALFLLAMIPLFAVGGGIVGAAAAHPAEEVEASIAAIEKVYADDRLLADVGEQTARLLRESGYRAFTGPAAPQTLSGPTIQDDTVQANTGDGCGDNPGQADVKIHVAYRFNTLGDYSPDLRYAIDVDAVVNGPSAGAANGTQYRWMYLSLEFAFLDVTKENARALRQSLLKAEAQIAQTIVHDLATARRPAYVTGVYYKSGAKASFRPGRLNPGVVRRIPTSSQLQALRSGAPSSDYEILGLSQAAKQPSAPGYADANSNSVSQGGKEDGPAATPGMSLVSAEKQVEHLCKVYEKKYADRCINDPKIASSNYNLYSIRIGTMTQFHLYSCQSAWQCPEDIVREYHNIN